MSLFYDTIPLKSSLKNFLLFFFIFGVVLLLGSPCSFGSFSSLFNITPFLPKTTYLIYEDKNFVYIFPQELKEEIPTLVEQNRHWLQVYEKEFNWTLDQKPYILFASPENHVPNAAATVVPFYETIMFNGTVHLNEILGSDSTSAFSLVSIHEIAHLFQLSVKSAPSSKRSQSLFGNLPLPFIFPNMLTPQFMTEGNATYNESRFHLGGRLYSPQHRALFFSLVKDKKVNKLRLLSSHLSFPFGREKYIVGGYFNAFLHSYYKNPNIFFLKHSEHYINPFLLNRTFKSVFGKGYHPLIKEFNHFYEHKKGALHQKQLNTPILAKSFAHHGLNRSHGKIFFLTTDYRSPNDLNIYDIIKDSFERKKTNLPDGKLFLFKENQKARFYSRSSQKIDLESTTFSLFDENLNPKKDYRGKYVFDTRGDHILFAKVDESFFKVLLYVNENPFGPAHSSPLLDEKGRVFDFQQKGKISHLIRDKKTLFSFPSYFPKLVDVSNDGNEVYFIGATKRGSSLFSLKIPDQQIFRLSHSDRIVDAKKIKKDDFLVVEVSSEGYTYHLLNPPNKKEKSNRPRKTKIKEKPHQVNFDSIQVEKNQKLKKQEFDSDQKTPLAFSIPSSELKPYKTFKQLKHVYTFPVFVSDLKSTFLGQIDFLFMDPLAQNLVQSSYKYSKFILPSEKKEPNVMTFRTRETEHTALFKYQYLKYALDLSFIYQFFYNLDNDSNSYQTTTDILHDLALEIRYPFFNKKNWKISGFSTIGERFFFAQSIDSMDSMDGQNHITNIFYPLLEAGIEFRYLEAFPLSFYPYRSFFLKLQGGSAFLQDKTFPSLQTTFSGIYDVGNENVFILDVNWEKLKEAYIYKSDLNLSSAFLPSFQSPFQNSPRLLNSYSLHTSKKHFLTGTITYAKVFNIYRSSLWGWLHNTYESSWWGFLQLRRFSTLVFASNTWSHPNLNWFQGYSFDLKTKWAPGLGVNMEFLILHRRPIKFTLFWTRKNFGFILGLL